MTKFDNLKRNYRCRKICNETGIRNSKKSLSEEIKNFILKHKVVASIIGILILLFIPIIINELYKIGRGYVTMWGAADVLSFYGSFLSFLGTVILGIVAFWQNHKAHKLNEDFQKLQQEQNEKNYRLNEQLQKLQQAQFVSMVSIKDVMVETRSTSTPKFMNTKMREIDIIDLTMNEFESPQSYHIDVEIKNDSEYPIVQMQVHPGSRNNGGMQLFGIKNLTDRAIYIPSKESACFRYIVPCKLFEHQNYYNLTLSIDFINIFDYRTCANLYIENLKQNKPRTKYQYRLSKFTDVHPQN